MAEAATATAAEKPEPEEIVDIVELKDGEAAPEPGKEKPDDDEDTPVDGARAAAEPAADADDDDDPTLNRKEQRRLQKEKQRTARERDRLEIEVGRRQIAALAERLAQLEGGQRSQSQYIVNARLEQAQTYKRQADLAFAEAAGKGDVAGIQQAQQHQQAADNAIRQLQQVGEQIKSAPAPQAITAPANPIAVRMAQKWADDHPWYDPQVRDPDSRLVAAIDLKLTQEGFDPGSAEYYAELDSRAAQLLPTRFGNGKNGAQRNGHDNPNRRRDMPSASSSEGAGAPGKVTYYVTPGRKKAMQDAGVWDDPKARNDMLREYQKYDRANPNQRR